MKKVILILVLALPLLGMAFEEDSVGINSVRIQPCGGWRYERFQSGGSGYVCSYTQGAVYVPSESDVQQLQRRVEALEARLLELEQK